MSNVYSKLVEAQNLLRQVKAALAAIEWSTAQVDDARLGEHLVALESHIDNAIGRCSTVAYRAGHPDK